MTALRRPGLSPADLMLLAVVAIWGFNFTVTKYLLSHHLAPLAYSSLRYGMGAVLFAGFVLARERSLAIARRDLRLLLGAAVVGIWVNQICFNYGVKLTTATTAALIFGTLPIWTALVASLAGFERLSRRFWVAAAISFAGVALVAAGSGGNFSGDIAGDVLTLLFTITWGAYSVAIAPLIGRYSAPRISALVIGVGVLPLAATGAPQLARQDWSLSALAWVGVVWGVLGALVLANLLWYGAIHRVGPSRATLFVNLQPFFGAIFAVLLLSEPLGALQIVGGLTILAGLAVSRRRMSTPVAAPGAGPGLPSGP